MTDKLEVRDGLLYTKDHEWAAVSPEGVRVGISAYAVDQLGDVTLVNVEVKVGDSITAGKGLGTTQGGKKVSDLFFPVGGEKKKKKTHLASRPPVVKQE